MLNSAMAKLSVNVPTEPKMINIKISFIVLILKFWSINFSFWNIENVKLTVKTANSKMIQKNRMPNSLIYGMNKNAVDQNNLDKIVNSKAFDGFSFPICFLSESIKKIPTVINNPRMIFFVEISSWKIKKLMRIQIMTLSLPKPMTLVAFPYFKD